MSHKRNQLLDKLDKAQAKFRKANLAYQESRGKGKLKEAAAWKAFRAADEELDLMVDEVNHFISENRKMHIH